MRKTATTQIAMKLNAPTPQILAAKLNHNNLIHVRSVQDKNNLYVVSSCSKKDMNI